MHWSDYAADPLLADFELVDAPPARMLVRSGYLPHLGRLGPGREPAAPATVVAGGRRAHPVVELPGGERVVVRAYRRGGAVRHLNPDRYFLGHRAFEELRATERARAGGVRTPLVLAAGERRARIGYTATLATRWIPDARELAGWLVGAGPAARLQVLRTAGVEIARMHAAGVAHPDLNLRNLLVAAGGDGAEVYLIDFDRARLFGAAVPPRRRSADLRRLARSARKLAAPIDPAGWDALRSGYGAGWPPGLALG